MDQSFNLGLPFILPAQAQKHVTHNEAINTLDAVVQIAVPTLSTVAPPASPEEGARYIVGVGASGVWAEHDQEIAVFQDAGWRFLKPQKGWVVWIEAEAGLRAWDGEAWAAPNTVAPETLPRLGVNTTADETNRLSVTAPATLLNHEGNDHRVFVNKAAAEDTASFIFQTGFAARAEFGLTGSDNWQVKVSPDGANWSDALIADQASGAVSLPGGLRHHLSGRAANTLIVTPGGQGEIWAYSIAPPHAATPRVFTVASVAGDIVRLTTPDAEHFYRNSAMENVSFVRIWNVSKPDPEPAWLARTEGVDGLQVLNAGDVAGWVSGDQVQLGDPESVTPGRVVALDISPYLQNQLGAVFPQQALLAAMVMRTNGGRGEMAITPNGFGGTFSNAFTPNDGSLISIEVTTPTTQLSPISNSNLLFLREDVPAPGLIDVCQCRLKGVWV